jgi:ParB family transcriptional regulator, chromosome partitioning protein
MKSTAEIREHQLLLALQNEYQLLAISAIEVPETGRPYNETDVSTLMQSIKAIGLLVPIAVDCYGDDYRYRLISGRHRLEACRGLGHETIPARVVTFSDVDRRLWTIAENLHRTELTTVQRSEQIAEWIRLTAEKVSSQVATKPHGGRPGSGVNAAARELGITKDEAHRAVKIDSITPEAKEALRAAKLDNNQAAALRVARYADQDQVEAVETIVEKAKAKPPHDLVTLASSPRTRNPASPLRDLTNISAGEFAKWIKLTAPDARPHVIQMLRMTADMLEIEENGEITRQSEART